MAIRYTSLLSGVAYGVMRNRFIEVLRSIAAVLGGYLTLAFGTILTFNVVVGQVTIDSSPFQLMFGTIGAALSGLAGGLVAGIVAPRFPFAHAVGVLIFLIIDTASVLAKSSGPLWFDLAGSAVLAFTVLVGGWIIARRREGEIVPHPAV
jgi:hypothetical protein